MSSGNIEVNVSKRWRRGWCCVVLVLAASSVSWSQNSAAAAPVAFLVGRDASGALATEDDIACDLATRLTSATVLLPAGDGRFVDRHGRPVSLDAFRVVWCHQDAIRQSGPLFDRPVVDALHRYVAGGRGLLLSGGATALVVPLGVDTVRTAIVPGGDDRAQAGLTPLAPWHPAMEGLDLDRGVLWISNAAMPAFSAFHPTSKPAKGMILARTPGGAENPLIEYALCGGRIVVFGWCQGRLYNEAATGYRRNFERLTANLLAYLGDARAWQPLRMASDGTPRAAGAVPAVPEAQWRSLELAVRDLAATFNERYPRGADYLRQLAALERGQAELSDVGRQFDRLRREALLANPLLNFDRLLLVKRGANNLGLPRNFESNSSLRPTGYDNQIAVLSPVGPAGKLATLYRPDGGRFVGDVDLHFDAGRLLFSQPDAKGRWQVWEINADGSRLRQLPLIEEPDVDNYDACYLPDGGIVFCSTACFTGVPCVNGTGHVANLYMLQSGGKIRQFTVEQDHDWCPTVLNDGRVLYLRWEYTDLPHAFSRRLFHMNPDGTGQSEYYGSNSYWPASMFYARPIPGHPTKVVAVVGGHHELPRMGDLVIFDPARGRFEADGRGRTHPRPWPQGRARAAGPADRPELAQVPSPVSAQREVLFGIVQAIGRCALGYLPGRRVRQLRAVARGAGLRDARADPAPQDAPPAGHSRQGRPCPARRRGVHCRSLSRRGPQRGAARNDQATAADQLPVRLPGHGGRAV
jgi:hypothetical protein